jgi:hypothetical protein
MVDTAFVWLPDAEAAQRCARVFWRRDWPRFLDCLARRVNPLSPQELKGQSYYCLGQLTIAKAAQGMLAL